MYKLDYSLHRFEFSTQIRNINSGLCASVEKIPIVHVAGMHQARPIDYSPEYIKRQKSISFHKFDEIDPYKTFGTYLREEKPDKNTKSKDEL